MEPVDTIRAPDGADRAARMRVLLVEDDDGDALIVEEELELSGARVDLSRARTLGEATALDLTAYDCALLDLNLPDADGLDGLRRLRELTPDLAVLVLTGLDDEQRGTEAVAAGAQDYLVKGSTSGVLLARALRYAVERRRAELTQQQLSIAQLQARENARLERGLLRGAAAAARTAMGLPSTMPTQGPAIPLADAVAYARRGRGARDRPPGGWAALTPAERDVARLAAGGASNPEVAAQLFMSRSTVKVHLSRAFAKLGVANRTELAALAARDYPAGR